MTPETEILKLAMLAYEAAAEPSLWPDFLKRYTEAAGSDFSVLQIHDLGRHESRIISGFGLNDRFLQSYNQHYSRLNIWRERGRALYIEGNVNFDEEYCPRPVFEHSEFFNDYMRLAGGHFSMAAIIRREGDLASALSTQRGRAKGSFGREEREIAQFLLPHLNRAWEVGKRLDLLAAGESVLEALPTGVVFFAAGGRAVYWNRAAEAVFRSNDGLAIKEGKLCVAGRLASIRLRKAMDDALSPGRSPGPAVVSVPRTLARNEQNGSAGLGPRLRGDYQVVAAPIRGGFRQFDGGPKPLAVVFITDPERQHPVEAELLVRAFNLTRKEAMLAAALSTGKPVRQAAEELAITYETARTHLRRIFSKTGVTRQAELLTIMGRLPSCSRAQRPVGGIHG